LYKILRGSPRFETPVGKPRCKLENTIKMNHREVGCVGVNTNQPAEDTESMDYCEHCDKLFPFRTRRDFLD
jgi:hypothetical protein